MYPYRKYVEYSIATKGHQKGLKWNLNFLFFNTLQQKKKQYQKNFEIRIKLNHFRKINFRKEPITRSRAPVSDKWRSSSQLYILCRSFKLLWFLLAGKVFRFRLSFSHKVSQSLCSCLLKSQLTLIISYSALFRYIFTLSPIDVAQ